MTVKPPVAQEAAWLNTLHPSDRKHAQRWLREVGGEGRLRRIAHAFNKAPAAAHRPQGAPLDLLDRAVEHAALLYVTTPKLTLGGAAGQTRRHFSREIAAGTVTEKHFLRKISDALKAKPEEFYRALAVQLATSGQAPRLDHFSDLVMLIKGKDRMAAFQRALVPPALISSSFANGVGLSKTTADAYARQLQAAARARDLVEFAALFDLPDHLPISRVANWFDAVRDHLEREQDIPSG